MSIIVYLSILIVSLIFIISTITAVKYILSPVHSINIHFIYNVTIYFSLQDTIIQVILLSILNSLFLFYLTLHMELLIYSRPLYLISGYLIHLNYIYF